MPGRQGVSSNSSAPRLLDRGSLSQCRAPTESAVDSFLQVTDANSGGRLVDVDALLRKTPRVVRWQFLCRLANRRRIAFHERVIRSSSVSSRMNRLTSRPLRPAAGRFARTTRSGEVHAIVDRRRHRLTLNMAAFVLEARAKRITTSRSAGTHSRNGLGAPATCT